MNSIYRVTVMVEDYQELQLSGPPLSVAADRGGVSDCFDLWFEHYDDSHKEMHRSYPIWVFGTGAPVPWTAYTRHAWTFLGTVVTASGLVWHVYTGHRKGETIGV